MTKMWNVAPGKEPIPGIGPGPLTDDEFEQRAQKIAERNGCDPEAYSASGAYVREGEPEAPAEDEEAGEPEAPAENDQED